MPFSLLPLHRHKCWYFLRAQGKSVIPFSGWTFHWKWHTFPMATGSLSIAHPVSSTDLLCPNYPSVSQPWASAQPQPSSHNCWAPRDYFPLPNGFHIRGKALNSLLHKGTATLSRKQMPQEHKCHEIPQLLFPEQKRKSIPKAPVPWALS